MHVESLSFISRRDFRRIRINCSNERTNDSRRIRIRKEVDLKSST